jgi:hypothetical protein
LVLIFKWQKALKQDEGFESSAEQHETELIMVNTVYLQYAERKIFYGQWNGIKLTNAVLCSVLYTVCTVILTWKIANLEQCVKFPGKKI